MPKQDWLEILENASKPKKGTKIPRGMDFYSLITAMSNAGMEIVPAGTSKSYEGMGLEPWNTGAGANGVVEPGKPVMLDKATNPPSVYHEGEIIQPFPGGKKIIPAQTEEDQEGLSMMEKEENLPGYATGGTVYDDPNSITPTTSVRPTNVYGLSPRAEEYQAGQDKAFETTKQRAAGNDPLMRNISNTALQNYDTRAAVTGIESSQFKASNPNLTQGALNAVDAKRRAEYGAGLSQLSGDLSRESMIRAEEANRDLFNQGRTGVQDELNKQTFEKTFGEQQYQSDLSEQKYQTSEKQRQADMFLAAGDYENYKAIVKEMTGRDISTADFEDDRSYLVEKRQQDIMSGWENVTSSILANEANRLGIGTDRLRAFTTAVNNGATLAAANAASGLNLTQEEFDSIGTRYSQTITGNEIALDRARNELGDAVYNSIQNMINGGSSLAAVNQKLQEQGKRPININEYSSMKDASGLGQQQWERQLSAFNMLLTSGDPVNIKNAGEKFSELFPGIDFSVDQLISDVGADRFAANMDDMSTIANSFDTWDEAKTSVEGLNLIASMGITEDKAKDLFRAMKINAIDEEWGTISNSDWFKTLSTSDPASAELIKNTFAAGLTGELEFDIQPVYNVTDKSGGFIQSFSNVADANKFIGENADKEYSVQEKKNYIYKDMGTGDTVVVNNGTGEATTTGEVPKEAKSAYDSFVNTLPSGVDVPYEDWDNSGQPTSFDKMSNIQRLSGIDIETPDQLLERDNSKYVFSAYKDNPAEFRNSEYYYKLPSVAELQQNITQTYEEPTLGIGGVVKKVKVSGDYKPTLDGAIGKIIELPKTGGGVLVGQLAGYEENPNTLIFKIRKEDGTYEDYAVFKNIESTSQGYRANILGEEVVRYT